MRRILILGLGPIVIDLITYFDMLDEEFMLEVVSDSYEFTDALNHKVIKSNEWLEKSQNTHYDFVINSWKESMSDLSSLRNQIIHKLSQIPNLQFIFLSSVAVYGECVESKNEESNLLPINTYGAAKEALEVAPSETANSKSKNVLVDKNFKWQIFLNSVSSLHFVVFKASTLPACFKELMSSALSVIRLISFLNPTTSRFVS